MKKVELNLLGCEMLTKDQMKHVIGGRTAPISCFAVDVFGNDGGLALYFDQVTEDVDCCGAQGRADALAYSDASSSDYPYGINCPCTCEYDD